MVNGTSSIFSTPDFRIESCANTRRALRRVLESCREERRPYLITLSTLPESPKSPELSSLSESMELSESPLALSERSERFGERGWGKGALLVPVSRLEEEVYKAEICTYLARKTGAEIILLQAKDYGSRAKQNVGKIVSRIEKVGSTLDTPIAYRVLQANSDSDHLMREAADRATELQADMLILTASRDYGLDDILFGPAELHAIRRSPVPCLLVNPRPDLFSLCD